jgi:uncharacterized protein YifN (PemK superfamily)
MRKMALGAVILVLLAACNSKTNGNTGTVRPLSTAKLSIVQPTSGQTVDGKDVEVKLKLDGGTVTTVTVSTARIKPNIGHIHLRLDGNTITLLGHLDNHIKDVKAGQHILEAEYVAQDHLPWRKDIVSAVTFTAR